MGAPLPLRRRGPRAFWALAAAGALVVLAGAGAAWHMEEHGHVVTGMNNQIVWGVPHVFAIFMIVAASGVLNVASIGSVFGRPGYKARAPLSGLLCLALLAGGLAVLMLDLGRPERLVVAATHYNPTSVFAWNVFLYAGMAAIVAVYLWMLLEPRMQRHAKAAGIAALVWRIVLTTGTGTIFAFLVARQAYGSALLPPLFVVMSLAWGLAVFVVVEAILHAATGRAAPPELAGRMRMLLALFVAGLLYCVAVYHVTNAYFARQGAFERFMLLDGGAYPVLFWGGYVALGTLLPLLLLWHPRLASARATLAAALLVIAGAFALLYAFVIGGQAFPLEIFPGWRAQSAFGDGSIGTYAPSLAEVALGAGGIGVAFLITLVGLHNLPFAPRDDAGATGAAPGG
ncbi:MAG TPA: NrfD/PsrC family molybdoenzyme membrane anchor subunit [Casimicrobiaceae bacterium]